MATHQCIAEVAGPSCAECLAAYEPGNGRGSTGKWLNPNVPKRNWFYVEVTDLGEESIKCEMCEEGNIRYQHTMGHSTHEKLNVGCICAGHMSGNIAMANRLDNTLRRRAAKRDRFPDLQNWKVAKSGNDYIAFSRRGKSYWAVIFKYKSGANMGKFSSMIEEKSADRREFTNIISDTKREAQLAAFDYLFSSRIQPDPRQEVDSYSSPVSLITNLVSEDPIALQRWIQIVERIVPHDNLRIKRLIYENGDYEGAILLSLEIWHAAGNAGLLDLLEVLRSYHLIRLAGMFTMYL